VTHLFKVGLFTNAGSLTLRMVSISHKNKNRMPGKKDMAGVRKRKGRQPPWCSMDNWVPERHENLSLERKKAVVLEKQRHRSSVKHPKGLVPPPRKNTSSEREKRRTQVESSVSGKELNIYIDTLEVPVHLDDISIDAKHSMGTAPPAFRLKGLPLVLFIPILIAIKPSLRKELFTKTRSISGTNTDQYYLKNQDPTLPKGEAVYQDWRKSTLLDRCSVCAIDSLAWSILEALPDVTNPEDWRVDVGFLCNRKDNGEVHQTLHLDVPEAVDFEDKTLLPYIVHIPLCTEGMALQVVSANGEDNPPNFRYYGFGEAAVLRADCWHGGCYGTKGNTRMRIYLSHKDFPDDPGVENLRHKRCGLPNTKAWPIASSILKLSQESDVKVHRSLRKNWYRNRLVSTMKGPEFLSLDVLSNV
jgi:hypothetical protein